MLVDPTTTDAERATVGRALPAARRAASRDGLPLPGSGRTTSGRSQHSPSSGRSSAATRRGRRSSPRTSCAASRASFAAISVTAPRLYGSPGRCRASLRGPASPPPTVSWPTLPGGRSNWTTTRARRFRPARGAESRPGADRPGGPRARSTREPDRLRAVLPGADTGRGSRVARVVASARLQAARGGAAEDAAAPRAGRVFVRREANRYARPGCARTPSELRRLNLHTAAGCCCACRKRCTPSWRRDPTPRASASTSSSSRRSHALSRVSARGAPALAPERERSLRIALIVNAIVVAIAAATAIALLIYAFR